MGKRMKKKNNDILTTIKFQKLKINSRKENLVFVRCFVKLTKN